MTDEDILRMARESGAIDSEQVIETVFSAFVAAEREKVDAWMMRQGYATGYGDTTDDLLKKLEWQIAENWTNALVRGVEGEREACAKVCEDEEATLLHKEGLTLPKGDPRLLNMAVVANFCAKAIRARGEK